MLKRVPTGLVWLVAACTNIGPAEPAGGSAARSARIEEVAAFEQQIQDAISRRDAAFLDRVTAPTFVRMDPEGRSEDRAAVMALIRQPPPTADIIRRTVDRDTLQVQLHGDIAVARGQLEVRGPRRAFRTIFLDVVRRESAGWRLLSSTTLSMTPLAP